MRSTGTFTRVFPAAGTPVPPGTKRSADIHSDRLKWVGRFLAILLLLLGPLFGLLAYRESSSRITAQQRAAFVAILDDRADEIVTRFRSLEEVLYACRGLFEASEFVSRLEFSRFTREARARHAVILAVEWSPRVTAAEREVHERSAREEGFESYRITSRNPEGRLETAPDRDVHYPILYVDPPIGNEAVVGFDLASEPRRRATLQQALATGQVAMSDAIHLVQTGSRVPGALLILGVERRTADGLADPSTPFGLITLAVRYDTLLRVAAGETRRGRDDLSLELVDVARDGTSTIVHTQERGGEVDSELASERRLDLAQHTWVLRAWPTPAFLARHESITPFVAALGAFVVWELLVALLLLVSGALRTQGLRRQAQVVRRVLRNLHEGLIVVDRTGRVRIANDAAVRLLGGPPGPDGSFRTWMRRCDIREGDAETTQDVESSPLARALQGESVGAEELHLHPRQEALRRSVSASARPLYDQSGAVEGAVTVMRDVTTQRKSEAHLKRLSRAIEQTADAVFITDTDGRIEYANSAFETLTGFSRNKVVGSTPRLLKSGAHDQAFYERLWGTIKEGRVYRGITINRRIDGESWHALQTITPIRNPAGVVTHFVASLRDITERRLLEAKNTEMELAYGVQQRLFPKHPPAGTKFDVAGAVLGAEATCGDYYDFLATGDGQLGLVVGDVSGHGLGPALVMAQTRAYLRSLVEAGRPPDETLRRLNLLLEEDLEAERFVTLLFATIDESSGRLSYASAGHTPGLLITASGEHTTLLNRTGPPLGVFRDSTFEAKHGLHMDPGDVLVVMTDGVTESMAPDGTMFEEQGVIDLVREHPNESAADILTRLQRALEAFTGRETPLDDVTAVVAKAPR